MSKIRMFYIKGVTDYRHSGGWVPFLMKYECPKCKEYGKFCKNEKGGLFHIEKLEYILNLPDNKIIWKYKITDDKFIVT